MRAGFACDHFVHKFIQWVTTEKKALRRESGYNDCKADYDVKTKTKNSKQWPNFV